MFKTFSFLLWLKTKNTIPSFFQQYFLSFSFPPQLRRSFLAWNTTSASIKQVNLFFNYIAWECVWFFKLATFHEFNKGTGTFHEFNKNLKSHLHRWVNVKKTRKVGYTLPPGLSLSPLPGSSDSPTSVWANAILCDGGQSMLSRDVGAASVGSPLGAPTSCPRSSPHKTEFSLWCYQHRSK